MMANYHLWFCAGTSGELIKLFPLLREADRQGIPWYFVFTGQSPVNFWLQWDDFRLDRSRTVSLVQSDRDLMTSRQALSWFIRAITVSSKKIITECNRVLNLQPAINDIWIVHGDTLSTVVGSLWARKVKGRVAHVEAGLRSESLIRPFPEEINRRIVSYIARLHFPQDTQAENNLITAGVKGKIIPSGGNTLYDALDILGEEAGGEGFHTIPYVVANIHRFENLGNADRWNVIVETLCRSAADQPVHLVLHPPTQAKLNSEPATRKLLEQAGVVLSQRVPFSRFIKMIHRARYVISDGGSNQEECAYLGKPCMILREETERIEGLAASCLLTRFQSHEIDRFLSNPEAFAREKTFFISPPSKVIIDALIHKWNSKE